MRVTPIDYHIYQNNTNINDSNRNNNNIKTNTNKIPSFLHSNTKKY